MAQRLIIMRHAKSSWSSGVIADHERPLNERGQKEAPQTAEQLMHLRWHPELILCSDAQRTLQTWEFMSPTLGDIDIQITNDLFEAEPDEVLQLIASQPLTIKTLMIIGHNPAAEAVVEWLCGEFIELKPANAALLFAEGNWSDILNQKGQWKLEKVITPVP